MPIKLWTEEETLRVDQWIKERRRITWMARQLGRSVNSVQNRINRAQHGMIGVKACKTPKKETIPCMCCHQPFISWDRKRNRLCPNCGRDGVTRFDTSHATLRPAKGFRGE